MYLVFEILLPIIIIVIITPTNERSHMPSSEIHFRSHLREIHGPFH
jgi:hypothetical protein